MSDFTPETRNSAIWSGDSRKVANGKIKAVMQRCMVQMHTRHVKNTFVMALIYPRSFRILNHP